VAVVLAIAALSVPTALAGTGKGGGNGGRAESAPVAVPPAVVSGPTRLAPRDYPAGADGTAPDSDGVASPNGDCGACIVTCWTAATRAGSGGWSGHVYIYQHLTWCGNGAVVTYGSVWQSYEQVGWYEIGGEFGPWWSGGCLGCASLSSSGYILWNWTAPVIDVNHSGTTYLNSTMYAYGGVSV
jgi:hypothetical protein